MTTASPDADYAVRTAADTVRLERLLPGPIERVWAYLTDSELRRQWLAAGEMDLREGAPFELTWRNDTLTDPPGTRPEGFGEEHGMSSVITAVDPPRRLAFAWQGGSEVIFALEPRGASVLLTVTHRRLHDAAVMGLVGPGWHMHLDVLVARLTGTRTVPFWDGWSRLRRDYAHRLPA